MNKNFFEEFGKPFADKDVSWRLQSVNEEKKCGRAIPYLDARAIADRLDAVVGQGHWRNTYTQWHDSTYRSKNKSVQKTSQLCTISIYDGIWINEEMYMLQMRCISFTKCFVCSVYNAKVLAGIRIITALMSYMRLDIVQWCNQQRLKR